MKPPFSKGHDLEFFLLFFNRSSDVLLQFGEGTQGSAREQDHPLLLPVVEEVVEAPQAAVVFGAEQRVGRQVVRVVGEDVALGQVDLAVEGHPEVVPDLAVAIGGGQGEQAVDIARDVLQGEDEVVYTFLFTNGLTLRLGSLLNSWLLASLKS